MFVNKQEETNRPLPVRYGSQARSTVEYQQQQGITDRGYYQSDAE